MTSFAQTHTNRMNLGPMRVTYNGVDLGGTIDNVELSLKYMKAEIKADQTGESVRDRRVSGVEIKITSSLVETQFKDNWKVVFPHASLVTQGGNKMIYWTEAIGDSDLAHANVLLLHPLSADDSDLSGDFTFFKAVASAESTLVKGPTEQDKLKIVWNILPDDSVYPEKYFIHGDPNIGVVPAEAATASYSGTGNGVITSLVANSGAVTETITLTCIAEASNAGTFQVSGSQSGPLGNAVVGLSFSSSKVGFTITDGSIDFDLNDQFTISVTGANYT